MAPVPASQGDPGATPASRRAPPVQVAVCTLFGLMLAACAAPGPRPDTRGPSAHYFLEERCARDLARLDERARELDIDPSRPRGIPGFPGLAMTRPLAAFDPDVLDAGQRSDWLARLVDAGERRRTLLEEVLADYGVGPWPSSGAAERACIETAVAAYRAADPDLKALATAARIPDDYVDALRVLGLYPVTSLPVRLGVSRLQDETRARFAARPERWEEERRYAPPGPPTPAGHRIPDEALDGLGVRPAMLDAATLDALFLHHAPVLAMETDRPFDRPGAPFWREARRPAVATTEPQAYRYATTMTFAGRLRLQLVYVFWFSERPRRGPLDTLGGDLDGLVWRVTLDEAGRPLLYDSIHPCGCYHLFFPAADVALRPSALELPEPPLVPAEAPALGSGDRLRLRIASATHYLVGLEVAAGDDAAVPTQRYTFAPYRALYAVEAPGGRASLFAEDGLVPGTQRGERFYLWPMGVPSPGAMRERGRQATAFLGRRHFDDGDLLDRLFVLQGPP